MDKKTLESYRPCRFRIGKLKEDIFDLKKRGEMQIAGKVHTSRQEFPWTYGSTTLYCETEESKSDRLNAISKKEQEMKECEKTVKEVEEFVDGIKDPIAKTVLEYYYIDGEIKPTQKEVANRLRTTRENVAQIIFKCA